MIAVVPLGRDSTQGNGNPFTPCSRREPIKMASVLPTPLMFDLWFYVPVNNHGHVDNASMGIT